MKIYKLISVSFAAIAVSAITCPVYAGDNSFKYSTFGPDAVVIRSPLASTDTGKKCPKGERRCQGTFIELPTIASFNGKQCKQGDRNCGGVFIEVPDALMAFRPQAGAF